MHNFHLSDFLIKLWVRLQVFYIIPLLVFTQDIGGIMVTEVICAICSSIACISYGIIAATCIRNAYIENPQKLSSILYNIGWLNTLGLFIIGLIFIPKMINISSFRDNIPLIGVLLFLIISGEISIFWVIKRCKPFADISFMPKEVIDSIAEIGENGTTESADFHR